MRRKVGWTVSCEILLINKLDLQFVIQGIMMMITPNSLVLQKKGAQMEEEEEAKGPIKG